MHALPATDLFQSLIRAVVHAPGLAVAVEACVAVAAPNRGIDLFIGLDLVPTVFFGNPQRKTIAAHRT